MGKILDYEEMLEILDNIKGDIIVEKEPIGYTHFNYPIPHYTYGKGENHIILTAGTHATELISNVFLLRLMEKLSKKEMSFDEKKYTIHFLPIINPEGTIVVTSAIRTLIKKDASEFIEEGICNQYYYNSKLEDVYVETYQDENPLKLQQYMFRYASSKCIDEKHKELRDSIEKLITKNNLPLGIMINWTSNGRGIDLNANIGTGVYFADFLEGKKKMGNLRLNGINLLVPGPMGCPSISKEFVFEKENIALINFYLKLIKEHRVIGSIIYHSCGNIVYYLDEMEEENPWVKDYGLSEIMSNRMVALKYFEESSFKVAGPTTYTTIDAMLKSYLPGTLLVELGDIRSTPLSQFSNYFNHCYDRIMNDNTNALKSVFEEMLYQKTILDDKKYHILVNKENSFHDDNLYKKVSYYSPYGEDRSLEETTASAFHELQQYLLAQGYEIFLESGYRSFQVQEEIWKEIEKEKGIEHTLKYVAKPGYSEHQTGLALDFCLKIEDNFLCDFEMTGNPVLEIVANNAHLFGFILRYPKEKVEITGYNHEPWHLRYVGKTLAKYLFENDLTLEEYYNKERFLTLIKSKSRK